MRGICLSPSQVTGSSATQRGDEGEIYHRRRAVGLTGGVRKWRRGSRARQSTGADGVPEWRTATPTARDAIALRARA